MNDDADALQAYAADCCEDSFLRLVDRYLPLVYSVAIRRLAGEHALAEEVAQTVFVDLARKAGSFDQKVVLAGWLHRHTCFIASRAARTETRRRLREKSAASNAFSLAEGEEPWRQIAPEIDDLLGRLKQSEREALILRFLEGRSLREVASLLCINEGAAQKRVHRALDKLRKLVARRRPAQSLSSSGLATLLTSHFLASAVPAHLGASVLAAAKVCGVASATAASITGLIAMTSMTKIKTAAAAALIVSLAIPLAVQKQSIERLQSENAELLRQSTELENFLANDSRPRQPNFGSALSAAEFSELLRLRGEVGQLRAVTNQMAELRSEIQRLRGASSGTVRPAVNEEPIPDIEAARNLIFAPAAAPEEKLHALRILRAADARTDDVVRQMVQVYYGSADIEVRADIFRQLHGVATPELKQPLLEAISDQSGHHALRQEAAETLDAFVDDEKVVAWLEHAASHDPDAEVREQAARSLEARERPGR